MPRLAGLGEQHRQENRQKKILHVFYHVASCGQQWQAWACMCCRLLSIYWKIFRHSSGLWCRRPRSVEGCLFFNRTMPFPHTYTPLPLQQQAASPTALSCWVLPKTGLFIAQALLWSRSLASKASLPSMFLFHYRYSFWSATPVAGLSTMGTQPGPRWPKSSRSKCVACRLHHRVWADWWSTLLQTSTVQVGCLQILPWVLHWRRENDQPPSRPATPNTKNNIQQPAPSKALHLTLKCSVSTISVTMLYLQYLSSDISIGWYWQPRDTPFSNVIHSPREPDTVWPRCSVGMAPWPPASATAIGCHACVAMPMT